MWTLLKKKNQLILATQQEIERLENELVEVRAQMDSYLKELGL